MIGDVNESNVKLFVSGNNMSSGFRGRVSIGELEMESAVIIIYSKDS
jgi:hypothetical protein